MTTATGAMTTFTPTMMIGVGVGAAAGFGAAKYFKKSVLLFIVLGAVAGYIATYPYGSAVNAISQASSTPQ